MRIAVVDALARGRGVRYSTFDVVGAGPRVVAGIAETLGHRAGLLTYEEAVSGGLDASVVDAVFISAMTTDMGAVVNLSRLLKNRGRDIVVVAGGPIGFSWRQLLSGSKDVDLVVVGEAEPVLPSLLDVLDREGLEGLKAGKVPALAYKSSSGDPFLTSPHLHASVQEITRFKHWSRVSLVYKPVGVYRYYVEVARGCSNFYRPILRELGCVRCMSCRSEVLEARFRCPVNIPPGCGFCSVPYMFGPARSIPVDYIREEVEDLVGDGARRIVLSAPDFLDYGRDWVVRGPLTDPCDPPANVDALEALLSSLSSISVFERGEGVLMVENIKACLVDESVARVLGRYLRGTTVHIGLETGDFEYNRDVLGKPIGLEHVAKASKLLRDAGLRPYVYLMYGLPLASPRVYYKTLNGLGRLAESGVEKITLYKYIPLPGTAFEKLGTPVLSKEVLKVVGELKKRIVDYNLSMKKQLLGGELEVYLLYSGGRFYGYPVKHGPVVFVKGVKSSGFSGCRAVVRVVGVGERYVTGLLERITAC
jgi:radical SAM superfamily enzyme YgiQ (UPF0313 family)